MALRKEIEKSLRREDTEVDAVEDHGIKDSVLAIASGDFKENDVLDLPLTSRKRSAADISADYPGKPVSRKKYGKDVGALESDESDDRSLSGLDDGLMGLEEEGDDDDNDEEEEGDDDDDDEDESDEEEESEEDEEGSEMDDEEDLHKSLEGSEDAGSAEEGSELRVFHSSPAASSEIQKGQAVKEQLRLWESLLECRIKMEPALVAANQLFQCEKMSNFINDVKSSGSSNLDTVHSSLQELSSSLKKLQVLLGRNTDVEAKKNDPEEEEDNESIKSSEASGISDEEEPGGSNPEEEEGDGQPPPKKTKPSPEENVDQIYSAFSGFRDVEIDRWNEKAKVSSGRAAQKDFSAFDQSILKLIESILFDKYRLVRKTQLKRADYVIYGKPKTEKKAEGDSHEEEIAADTLISSDKTQTKKDLVYDPEIFDDGDFYQKLLRDFIEAKSSDGGVSKHERKLMELHRLRIKMKRKIDTRATKGRKLRYIVHPKLVNYMAPEPSYTLTTEAEAQLLKSLFGQAVTTSA